MSTRLRAGRGPSQSGLDVRTALACSRNKRKWIWRVGSKGESGVECRIEKLVRARSDSWRKSIGSSEGCSK